MRVLLVGGGGREHALAWTISRSPELTELIAAPGNPGMGRLARPAPVGAEDVGGLTDLAASEGVDLVVAGPEAALAAGLADRLAERNIPCFGPRADAALLEASKEFAKDFMGRHGIPTARHAVVRDVAAAREALRSGDYGEQPVIKASGLAAGKGVFLPEDLDAAERDATRLLEGGLGDAGKAVVIEERLAGPELSVFAISDGTRVVACGTAQDYKRRFEGDEGPNTGGMGSLSPGLGDNAATMARVRREIVEPTIAGLCAEGREYRGVLYAGLMLTADGPRVLEFNVRFGDPEAQTLMPRLACDLLPLFFGAATGRLPDGEVRFRPERAVTVILASDGYPGAYQKGVPIQGLPDTVETGEAFVFHAGTRAAANGIETAGGRVIAVTGLGTDWAGARSAAYRCADSITWEKKAFRRDIAATATQKETT
ncbi:MAG: phosphoribosylamine--glycine ligase [Acidobacteria bacterium]|nr:phosphoribosylamine--glycine ligase [Acidobacteriota bacterium]